MPTTPNFLSAMLLAFLLLGANLVLRFLRWHYLLRRVGLMFPERLSLQVYLASFMFNFTPFYLGPIIYRVIRLKPVGVEGTLRRRVLGVALAELFYDAAGLAVIGLLGFLVHPLDLSSLLIFGGIFVATLLPPVRNALSGAYCMVVNKLVRLTGGDEVGLSSRHFSAIFQAPRYMLCLFVSTLAWLPPALFLVFLLRAHGVEGGIFQAMREMARATFASLVFAPFGADAFESSLAPFLSSGMNAAQRAAFVLEFRLGTYWLAMLVGLAAWVFGRIRTAALSKKPDFHFDDIAEIYDAQIPTHIRERLLQRKTDVMRRHLESSRGNVAGAVGLDLGCGQGYYMREMTSQGAQMTGCDLSIEQARFARERAPRVLAASAENLPFASASFDFIYSINVIHHLPSRASQERAIAEIRRILKPGGVFFLHEINPANPLFLLYMSYLFPLIRKIDIGTELWIKPGQWEGFSTWHPNDVAFYTFMPDFIPAFAMSMFQGLESRLENSSLKHLSAHYSAMFRKPEA